MKKIKKVVCLALSLLLCVASVPMQITSFAEEEYCPFSGGTGTEDNPYQIATAYDLRHLSELVNNPEETENYTKCYYIQTDDINLNDGRDKFTPIGEWVENHVPFRGNYNGNYHKIKNLDVNNDLDYVGLFGIVMGGTISNLSVEGNVITTGAICGGIAGEISENTNIKNCSFTGNVSGNRYAVGGIAGQLVRGGEVTSCYFNGNVDVKNVCCGGIIGTLSDQKVVCNSKITNCYAVGTVKAESLYGGILGNTERNQNDSAYVVENNYYLDSMSNIGSSGVVTNGCQSMDSDFMKNIDELLEKPFVHNDSSELNDGYPVFEWQSIPYQFKGSGTADDPYQISSKEELEKMRDLVNSQFFTNDYSNKCYIQTADIDLKNEPWTPIGKRMVNNVDLSAPLFWGSYNGNYHTIKNLFVTETEKNKYSGLFGSFRGNGIIENLIVYGEVKSNGGGVGGIAGEIVNGGGTVKNCAFIGNVCGHDAVGGIAGVIFQNGSIDGCYHIGNISAIEEENTRDIGGIVGQLFAGDHYEGVSTVKNCYNIGQVIGSQDSIGSIVGRMELRDKVHGEVYVSNCYSIKGEASTNANGNYNSYEVIALSENMLKNDAIQELRSPFIKNSNTDFNSGYPVFWWQLSGDTNSDGKLSVTDVVAVQKWLHKQGSLSEWQNVDFNGDGKINVVDLCLMKRLLLKM